MANVAHSTLTGSNLHENKGVASATDNHVATAVSGATVWAKLTASNLTGTGNAFGAQLLHCQERKTVDGGAITATTWTTRQLTDAVTNEISSASLATYQISLPAGTYFAQCSATLQSEAGAHKIRLYNITDAAVILSGMPLRNNNGAPTGSISLANGRFTLSGTKTIELQHYSVVANASANAMGNATGTGTDVFSEVLIWKVG